jgi:hypothetical protein
LERRLRRDDAAFILYAQIMISFSVIDDLFLNIFSHCNFATLHERIKSIKSRKCFAFQKKRYTFASQIKNEAV